MALQFGGLVFHLVLEGLPLCPRHLVSPPVILAATMTDTDIVDFALEVLRLSIE